MYITEKYVLPKFIIDKLKNLKDPYEDNLLGKVVFLRTYSRVKNDNTKETWLDTVVRVVEGVMSIRKTFFIKNNLNWEVDNSFIEEFAIYLYQMRFTPPGRGLSCLGTKHVAEKGSAFLFNCFAIELESLPRDCSHILDFLACGIGAGVGLNFKGDILEPRNETYTHIVGDSREGWAEGLYAIINAFSLNEEGKQGKFPIFDYSLIRSEGAPISSGGISSGYKPLKICYDRITMCFKTYLAVQKLNDNSSLEDKCKPYYDYIDYCFQNKFYFNQNEQWLNEAKNKIKKSIEDGKKSYNIVRLQADIIGSIASCIVAGNIRRSAVILLCNAGNEEFTVLKDLEINPERSDIYWTSNNSIILTKNEDFYKYLPKISESIRINGEPGFLNQISSQRYGRLGEIKPDKGTLTNPCSEITLESCELCCLSECFFTKCVDENGDFDENIFLKAVEFATWYASTILLLPTHNKLTNAVVQRNRRIGVSLSGIIHYYEKYGMTHLTTLLKKAYLLSKEVNCRLASEAGIRESIKITTIKPSGTISKLIGCASGCHFPTASHIIRRIRIGKDHDLSKELIKAGIPYEDDMYNNTTYCFMFPISYGKSIRNAREVSMWEKLSLTSGLQRLWSDNCVSVTITFNKDEESSIEKALGLYAPLVKSLSMLPNFDDDNCSYVQMPEENVSYINYRLLKKWIGNVSHLIGGNSSNLSFPHEELLYCTNDSCNIENYNNINPTDHLGRNDKFIQIRNLLFSDDKVNARKYLNDEGICINDDEWIHCFVHEKLHQRDKSTCFYFAIVNEKDIDMYKSKNEYDESIINKLEDVKLFSLERDGNMKIKY